MQLTAVYVMLINFWSPCILRLPSSDLSRKLCPAGGHIFLSLLSYIDKWVILAKLLDGCLLKALLKIDMQEACCILLAEVNQHWCGLEDTVIHVARIKSSQTLRHFVTTDQKFNCPPFSLRQLKKEVVTFVWPRFLQGQLWVLQWK